MSGRPIKLPHVQCPACGGRARPAFSLTVRHAVALNDDAVNDNNPPPEALASAVPT